MRDVCGCRFLRVFLCLFCISLENKKSAAFIVFLDSISLFTFYFSCSCNYSSLHQGLCAVPRSARDDQGRMHHGAGVVGVLVINKDRQTRLLLRHGELGCPASVCPAKARRGKDKAALLRYLSIGLLPQ